MMGQQARLAKIGQLREKLLAGGFTPLEFDLAILSLLEDAAPGTPPLPDSLAERFPYPVAIAHAHLDAPGCSWQVRHQALYFTVYQAMRMVALPLVGQYLRCDAADAEAARCFDKALAKLQCPHFNDWITVLHTARKYGTRLGLDILDGLDPHGFREGLGLLAERKIRLRGQEWPILEAFRELRNATGHGGLLDDEVCRRAFDQFRPAVDEVLEAFGFLANCRLVAVLQNEDSPQQLELRGSHPKRLVQPEDLPPGAPAVHLLVPGRAAHLLFPFLHPHLGEEPLFAYDGHFVRRGDGGSAVIRYLGSGERREVDDLESSPSACRSLQELWKERTESRSRQLLSGGPEAMRAHVAALTTEALEALERDFGLSGLMAARPGLEEPIRRFLQATEAGRALLVLGRPGAGKSALLLACLRNEPEFCRRVLLVRGEWLGWRPEWKERQLEANLWALLGGDSSTGPGPGDLLLRLAEAQVVLVLDGLDHSPRPERMVNEALRWLESTPIRLVLALRTDAADYLRQAAWHVKDLFAPVPGRRRPGLPPFLEIPGPNTVRPSEPALPARLASWFRELSASRPELPRALERMTALWLANGTCRMEAQDGSELDRPSDGPSDLEVLLLEGVLRRDTPADEPLYHVPEEDTREFLLFRSLFPGGLPSAADARRQASRAVDHEAFPEYSGAFEFVLRTWLGHGDLAAVADFLGDPKVPLPVRRRATAGLAKQALASREVGTLLGSVLTLAEPGSREHLCLARTFLWDLEPQLRRRLPPPELGQVLAATEMALRTCLVAVPLQEEAPDIRRSLAVIWTILAATEEESTDVTSAEGHLKVAVDWSRSWFQKRPHDPQARKDLGESLLQSGRFYLRVGRLTEAESSCREALELAATPRAEAAACSALAQVLWGSRMLDELRPVLARALRSVRWVARTEPADPEDARALHSILGRVADLHRVSGRPQHAERILRLVVQGAEARLSRDPGDEDLARSVAVAHGRLAEIERELGDLPGAVRDSTRSIAITRDLLERLPESLPDRANLVGALSRLADILTTQEKASEAAELRAEVVQLKRGDHPKPDNPARS